jgi:hypothetical protein
MVSVIIINFELSKLCWAEPHWMRCYCMSVFDYCWAGNLTLSVKVYPPPSCLLIYSEHWPGRKNIRKTEIYYNAFCIISD